MRQVEIITAHDLSEHAALQLLTQPSSEVLEQIAELYREWLIQDPCSHCACFGGVQYARDTQWIAEHMRMPGARLMAAERHERIVGFAQYFIEDGAFPPFAGDIAERFAEHGKLAYMYLILVGRELQGQGVGRALYHSVFQDCSAHGCSAMIAEVFVCPVPNSSSLKFHESLGFEYSGLTTTHSRELERGSISLTYTQLIRHLGQSA